MFDVLTVLNNGILFSIWRNDIEKCKSLVTNSDQANKVYNNGQTALHFASWEGRTSLLELLLQKGALVNAKDDQGDTPLHNASRNARWECCQLLLSFAADPSLRNAKGLTAIDVSNDQFILKQIIASAASYSFSLSTSSSPISLSSFDPLQTASQLRLARCSLSVFDAWSKSSSDVSWGWKAIEELLPQVPPDALRMGDLIAKGGFGQVREGWIVSKEERLAVKMIPFTKDSEIEPNFITRVQRELFLMGLLSNLIHRNIISAVGWFLNDSTNICGIVMPMAEMNLKSFVVQLKNKCNDREKALCFLTWVACEVANALVLLHELGIAFRDLKLENILMFKKQLENNTNNNSATDLTSVENWEVRLTDFGISRIISTGPSQTIGTGTREWAAPESFLREWCGGSAASDVYSFGYLLWCLFNLEVSPHADTFVHEITATKIKIAKGETKELPQPLPKLSSNETETTKALERTFSHLIELCWANDISRKGIDWGRPTISSISKQLRFALKQNTKLE